MFNVAFFVIVLLLGLMSVNTMSIKRSAKSESNLEKVDETEYPIKVNYDVYPVRNQSFLLSNKSDFCFSWISYAEFSAIRIWITRRQGYLCHGRINQKKRAWVSWNLTGDERTRRVVSPSAFWFFHHSSCTFILFCYCSPFIDNNQSVMEMNIAAHRKRSTHFSDENYFE